MLSHPHPLTVETLEHIFHGHVRQGKASGFHSNRGAMQAVKSTQIISGTETPLDANGVYEARVKVQGITKPPKSSFFLDTWTKADVARAVKQAYANRANIAYRPASYFEGRSVSGVLIAMFLNADATIATAYPLYGR